MNDFFLKLKDSSPERLVWLIIILGCSIGGFLLFIAGFTYLDLKKNRIQIYNQQRDISEFRTVIERQIVGAEYEFIALLDRKEVTQRSFTQDWLKNLVILYHDSLNISEFSRAVSNLDKALLDLIEVRKKSDAWLSGLQDLEYEFPIVRTEALQALHEMVDAIEKDRGNQRLDLALKIRDIRSQTGHVNRPLFNEIIHDESRASDSIKTLMDVSDLELFIHEMIHQEDLELLRILKDDKIRTTLIRLRGVNRYPGEQKQNFISELITDFERVVFGDLYEINRNHQTIYPGLGGLYNTCEKIRKSEYVRNSLRAGVVNAIADVREASKQLTDQAEKYINSEIISTEEALQQSMKSMIVVWLVSTTLFLILSWNILKAVRSQIKTIENTNMELDLQTKALLVSEDALKRMMGDLDNRVKSRTGELETANVKLEKEARERQKTSEELKLKTEELASAFKTAIKAQKIAEDERDRSRVMLGEAVMRERRMVELKREVNTLLTEQKEPVKYKAPEQVDRFLNKKKISSG